MLRSSSALLTYREILLIKPTDAGPSTSYEADDWGRGKSYGESSPIKRLISVMRPLSTVEGVTKSKPTGKGAKKYGGSRCTYTFHLNFVCGVPCHHLEDRF